MPSLISMINGSLGRCRPREMGTKDTKAASIQIAPIVATATNRVTQRVYLRKRRFVKKKKNKRMMCFRYNVNTGIRIGRGRADGGHFHALVSTAGCAKEKRWLNSYRVYVPSLGNLTRGVQMYRHPSTEDNSLANLFRLLTLN